MPTDAEFEFQFRWAEIAADGLHSSADKLEARDQALEQKLADGFGSCAIEFNYTYRWFQILNEDEAVQIALLDARDQALEQAIIDSGGCVLELPYRWSQLVSGMARGEAWAFDCAEDNDRVIEDRFSSCSCASGIVTGAPYSDGTANSDTYVFPVDGTISEFRIQATDCIPETTWYILVSSGREIDITTLTGGDFDCVYDLTTNTLSGTFPPDASVIDLFNGIVFSGQIMSFNVSASGPFATLNPFQLSVTYSGGSAVLEWFNV